MKDIGHQLKVNVPQLFKEILGNNGTGILRIPLTVTLNLLGQVAQRAIEINDPQLNALMIRLALYSVSDENSPDFNLDFVNDYLDKNHREVIG